MSNIKRLLIAACFTVLFIGTLQAQTNSPYSRYGYGILRDQVTGVSKGMGGASYGIRNSLSANVANPASYSAVDSLTFLFDFGVYVNRSVLKDEMGSRGDYNGGIDYLTLLFPVHRNLGVSVGLLPYTTVGYDFASVGNDGSLSYTKSYHGKGGFNQVYVGVGYELPVKGLSLGVNASYLFGRLEHQFGLSSLGGQSSILTNEINELRLNGFKFDIGVQYNFSPNKNNEFTAGLVYTPEVNTKARANRYFIEGAFVDTTTTSKVSTGIPHTIGIGGAWTYKEKWTLAADYTFQKWSSVKYDPSHGDGLNSSNRFNDRSRFNMGAEFMADRYSRDFLKRVRYRGGFNVSNSYLNVKNAFDGQVKGYNEYGVTLGLGLPIYDRLYYRTSYININFEYKRISPKIKSMISENYFGISVGINLNEMWFRQRKVE